MLREKLRQQRGLEQVAVDTETQLKLIAKRNIEIKRSYELSKQGIVVDVSAFEPEANLMFHMRLSTSSQIKNLYAEFQQSCDRFNRTLRMSEDSQLARVLKYVNYVNGDLKKLPQTVEKDHYVFKQEFDKKKEDFQNSIKFQAKQINAKSNEILSCELENDFLQQRGFTYSSRTFDVLFSKKWQAEAELSSEEDEVMAPPVEIQQDNQELAIEEVPEEIEVIDRPPLLDISQIDPTKVNWFKYIIDTAMQDSEDGSAMNTTDSYANLLNILLSSKKNEEIQEDLLDLVGFHNFEMLGLFFEKRELIKEYCRVLNEKIQAEKNLNDKYKAKNFDFPQGKTLGVTVQFVNTKGKSQKKNKQAAQIEMTKGNNFEMLIALGFDKNLISQNKRLGLKEINNRNLNCYVLQHAQDMQDDDVIMEHSKEVKAQIYKNLTEGKSQIVTEDNDDYKFVSITPPPKAPVPKTGLVAINSLPKFAQQAFGSASHLNQIQTVVFPVAFKQSRSILVAAPTGAGKTNIALMTILREVSLHVDVNAQGGWSLKDKPCKIVYIAPLKALASEIVNKFQSALGYLGVIVKELTGDMGLTKQEIQETHVIVATPEKWDVVTRKTDGMMNLVNVLIIDEIHLLNDERGLVLECLVARALSTGMKMQRPIRIVGLSATLPNFEDVAEFIGADSQGTFAFDSSYRPTPLKCSFYGIKEMGNAQRGNNIMNEIIFENLVRILEMGKQIIIFAHKRAETYTTAMELIEILKTRPKFQQLFNCDSKYMVQKHVDQSRNDQVKELFRHGFSTHHAGMLRKDRNLVETLFHNGDIKVLCSTSTLAWGVNLPAYCVLIKGTKVYDSAAGAYKDIGVFDVQQIFGRAGRPQFDKEGEAIILTPQKQMDEYVRMMQNKQFVESHLDKGLENCINAEIAAGQICTISEGVQWLKKSFFYVRLLKNPNNYSVKITDLQMDPTGHMILLEKVTECVAKLNRARLVRYNKTTEQVYSTDMGRIASNYYINVETMSYFMANLKPHTQENMLLFHLAQANEFKQLDARKEEYEELKMLVSECKVVEVHKDNYNEAYTKVLCLLEAYLKHRQIKTFSLISDMAYVVQNAARLLRAMFEIALQKNFAGLAKSCLAWCQILDKRLMPGSHIMKQFTQDCWIGKLTNQNQHVTSHGYMRDETAYRLNQFQIRLEDIYDKELAEAGRYISPVHQDELYKFLSFLPFLECNVAFQPITRTILKIQLTINAEFCWNDRWNGTSEPFWIMVDNDTEILHQEFFSLQKKSVRKPGQTKLNQEDQIQLTFFVPYQVQEGQDRISPGTYYNLEIISDRWYDLNFFVPIELSGLAVPDEDYPNTKLLPLRPMAITALGDSKFEQLYKPKFSFFNPIQTQVFHTLFHTDVNVLVGAPTGSGKTIMAELAMLRVFRQTPNKKIIYIAPLKALAKERIIDWKLRLGSDLMRKSVLELTGDCTPDLIALKEADLLITTPEKWDGISRNWQHRSYVSDVALVIIDEIHLLGQDRGPVIEVIISRMRYIAEQTGSSVRFIGLSTALANAKDVADWLGVPKSGLFNFKPSVRPVPIKVFFEGFPEKHYCPRMATMNKPAFKAINTHSRENPVLVFVSSRRQTRLTALDLIALSAADQQERLAHQSGDQLDFKKPFLHMDAEEISILSEFIKDESLKHTIQFGVGMHHAGLEESDRKLVEDLFSKKKIQILVTTSTLAWGVNFPARLVVIKGTEFFDPATKRYVDFPLTDLLQMIGRAGRPGMDDHGIACVMVHEEKKNFYKKFLYEPFPVESSLAKSLTNHLNAEIASGTLSNKKNCIDYLTWTYFFRRLTKNPAFYNVDVQDANSINIYLRQLVDSTLKKLESAKLVELEADSDSIRPTTLGYLASYYYLDYKTMATMQDKIQESTGIEKLIDLLSKAEEFSGLPVRHNEDVLNEALSHLVPLKIPKHDLENPHVKANLLLQAHFERCPLPITDFITDSKSVLDQSVRVLQGMIDVATHKGYLKTVINCIHLLQMLVQGQWLNQSPFLNIPYLNIAKIKQLNSKGLHHLIQLIYSEDQLAIFKSIGLNQAEISEISKALDRVPKVQMRWSAVSVNEMNEPIQNQLLEQGGEAQITVSLRRTNENAYQNVVINNFPKHKEPTWFVVIGNPKTNDLVCMKRISVKKFSSKNLIVLLPQDFDNVYDLYLMCDSYIGLDQMVQLNFQKVNERIKPMQIKDSKVSCDDFDDCFEKYYPASQQLQSTSEESSEEESFEFDVQPEDIYDLTVF